MLLLRWELTGRQFGLLHWQFVCGFWWNKERRKAVTMRSRSRWVHCDVSVFFQSVFSSHFVTFYNTHDDIVRTCLCVCVLCRYMSSVSSRRIQVNNVSLHCDITGTGNHAVLLLPGALGRYLKNVFCIAINYMQIVQFTCLMKAHLGQITYLLVRVILLCLILRKY